MALLDASLNIFNFKLFSYMHALSTFFHQGYDLMRDLDPFLRTVSSQVSFCCVANSYCDITLDFVVQLDELRQSAQKDHTQMMTEQERYMTMVSVVCAMVVVVVTFIFRCWTSGSRKCCFCKLLELQLENIRSD